jgi:putative ATPase
MTGVAELRKVFATAESQLTPLIVFIDEIHRFNKAQQDALLHPIERGRITLIGATTENPSFSLNNALLSRTRVLTLKPLTKEHLEALFLRADALIGPLPLTHEARQYLITIADGDGRRLLNAIETIKVASVKQPLDVTALAQYLQERTAFFDRDRDYHYNLISALIKSMRGSDPQAALYWFARLLEGGENPLYIARRLIRFAAEDIGLADPQALTHAVAAANSYERLGSPEGDLCITNSILYLSTAPKSNAAYVAMKRVQQAVKEGNSLMPPLHILNAPTQLMRHEGYAKGYQYDHDTPEGFSGQEYFPDDMTPQTYYHPLDRGFEREIRKRLEYWQKLKQQKKGT